MAMLRHALEHSSIEMKPMKGPGTHHRTSRQATSNADSQPKAGPYLHPGRRQTTELLSLWLHRVHIRRRRCWNVEISAGPCQSCAAAEMGGINHWSWTPQQTRVKLKWGPPIMLESAYFKTEPNQREIHHVRCSRKSL
jgi:hypothetical protein